MCHVRDDHCSELFSFFINIIYYDISHCCKDNDSDDQGWPLQSTVCRLELNKKSVCPRILHLLLTGDHDDDDYDDEDEDDVDDEDDEDYDDDDDDDFDNENNDDDDDCI